MGVCGCSMFFCMLLYVHSSIAIILIGKKELVALLNLSSWCLVMVERLFLAVPWGCLRFVIVVFPDHTHYFLLVVLDSPLMHARTHALTRELFKVCVLFIYILYMPCSTYFGTYHICQGSDV